MKNILVPAQIPIAESFRLLFWLKAKHGAIIHKSDQDKHCRHYGIDSRTYKKLITELLNDGYIGQDANLYFLRNTQFICKRLKIGTRAFVASEEELKDKKLFQGRLFAARVDYLNRYYLRKTRGSRKKRGCNTSYALQPPLNTGLLSEALQISTGKITQIKRVSSFEGFIKVNKTFTQICPGTVQTASILKDEMPGVFYKDGHVVRRSADVIESLISTKIVRNWKYCEAYYSQKGKKQWRLI